MTECPHISSSVRIAAVNLSQLQILREFNEIDQRGARARPKKRQNCHDLDKVSWNCVTCDSSESPWLCLACGLIFCGRYVNAHGIKHDKDMSHGHKRHCLTIHCYDYDVFCYACDDYVYGDTEDKKIYAVRHSLEFFNKSRCTDHSYSQVYTANDSPVYDDDPIDLGTEEEDEVTQVVAGRIIQLDEDSGSVPEDDVTPWLRSSQSQPILDISPHHLVPDISYNTGPLISTRSLRPRKRKQSFTLSPSESPSPPAISAPPMMHRSASARLSDHMYKGDGIFRGLKNLINTCFMNSVIQSLNAVDMFREYLIHLPMLEPDDMSDEHQPLASPRYNTRRAASAVSTTDSGSPAPTTPPGVLAEELRKVLIELSEKSSQSLPVAPSEFLQTVWRVAPRFRGYQQQDSHEFLRLVLERMHAELRRCRIPEAVDQWLTRRCGGADAPNASLVSRTFEGSLQSQVVCLTCHTASNKHDPFMDLSLDIFSPAANGRASNVQLSDCIHRFFAKEELDQCEQYMCGNCMDKRPSTKQLFLKVLPNVLCLHLKRFRWSHLSRGKLDNMVDFPLSGLDITQFMAPVACRSVSVEVAESLTFDLSSVVVHHGSGVTSGHYTTFGRRNGSWFHFNDAIVKACNEQTVLKQKAYLLFYTRSTSAGGGRRTKP